MKKQTEKLTKLQIDIMARLANNSHLNSFFLEAQVGAIRNILIKKGVFTDNEFYKSLNEQLDHLEKNIEEVMKKPDYYTNVAKKLGFLE